MDGRSWEAEFVHASAAPNGLASSQAAQHGGLLAIAPRCSYFPRGDVRNFLPDGGNLTGPSGAFQPLDGSPAQSLSQAAADRFQRISAKKFIATRASISGYSEVISGNCQALIPLMPVYTKHRIRPKRVRGQVHPKPSERRACTYMGQWASLTCRCAEARRLNLGRFISLQVKFTFQKSACGVPAFFKSCRNAADF
jgi:hypothetical protein